jgi:hypothetical protein
MGPFCASLGDVAQFGEHDDLRSVGALGHTVEVEIEGTLIFSDYLLWQFSLIL